ncbi:sugar ABC transporter permease [Candidatus Pacearchaeota archaeon]|nr:sugar ABC transporter permease [Candidatus Pacearchaeota archaeon]
MKQTGETALKKGLSDRVFALILIFPALLVVTFIIIYPLINSFVTSFFRHYLTDAEGMSFIGFKNYLRMFGNEDFWLAFLNTAVYVSGTVVAEFIFAFALALLINYHFLGKNIVNGLFFLPWIIPSVVVALITKFLLFDHFHGIVNVVLKRIGFINEFVPWLKDPVLAMPTVIFATTWKMFPFMFVILYAGLQAIPVEQIEAAKVDGANGFQRFIHVIIPNMKEIITLATILEFIWQFQYITIIWTTTKGGPINKTTTLPVLIYRSSFRGSMNMGYSSAIGVFWLVFLMGFSIFYVSYMGRGNGER